MLLSYGASFLIKGILKPQVAVDNYSFEYGESIELKAEDLFDESDLESIKTFDYDISNLEKDFRGNILVGNYPININYASKLWKYTQTINLAIVDTSAPKIELKTNQLTIDVGDKIDVLDYITSSDLSEYEVQFDDSKLDVKVPGTYQILITACDVYENCSEETLEVIVKEEIVPPVVAKPDPEAPSQPPKPPVNEVKPTYVDGILIVNKKYGIPSNFASGEDPTAKAALVKMINEMQSLGFDIQNGYSGFRNYAYQKQLYENYKAKDGQAAADTYSARPGHSEHQTGLTFDLKHKNGALVEGAAEAAWIKDNAHKFGFIVRYPKGKEAITGYMHEPWHLRYIGPRASDIYSSNLSLEEYLNVEGGNYR